MTVSAIAILQNHCYTAKQKERDHNERKKTVQPLFSIEIMTINSQIAGTAEAFNPSTPEAYPVHKNVTLKIENAGAFPVRNVIIFDKYLCQLLKPNDLKTIQVAYSDSPDIKRWKSQLIEIHEADYERTEKWMPKRFSINYDDVDGHEMYQLFELKDFDGVAYYSLEKTEEI